MGPLDQQIAEDSALWRILEETATHTGEGFFDSLVENLAKTLDVPGAWVTEYDPERRRLRALAFWLDGRRAPHFDYCVDGTPCAEVVDEKRLVIVHDHITELYPQDEPALNTKAASYMGMPLLDHSGEVAGHLGVIDRVPLMENPRSTALFRIFADRAAAELRRLRVDRDIREREEQLARLIDSAMDAIIQLDLGLRVTRMNTAAERIFGCAAGDACGSGFNRFLTEESHSRLQDLIEELDSHPEGQRSQWIPGGLRARRASGEEFAAEATVSRFEVQRRTYHTLILRDVHERQEAENRIRTLTEVTEYLRNEVRAVHNFGEIVGQSPPMQRVITAIKQVADAEATVLVQGETGTGKELVARAIHRASRRQALPMIRVNCAAIPATLIESEFFGHEKGAFTGATQRRDGRFSLADGGSIFLDEIGELPLDLQSKLLRVLQEGEFEPVGTAETRRVDVRVIAATNRDLLREVEAGRFREDLYYRLNVFPIEIPPLRERPEDIPPLAYVFAERAAKRSGRRTPTLTDACIRRLRTYAWPGNVRELQNVIERAVIISRGDLLDLEAALPDTPSASSQPMTPLASDAVLTVAELQCLERDNIVRALEASKWKVSGSGGAAELLGMKPSTLSSRIKALGIEKPS